MPPAPAPAVDAGCWVSTKAVDFIDKIRLIIYTKKRVFQ